MIGRGARVQGMAGPQASSRVTIPRWCKAGPFDSAKLAGKNNRVVWVIPASDLETV